MSDDAHDIDDVDREVDRAAASLHQLLIGDHPLDEVLLRVVEEACEVTGADAGSITTVREGTPETTVATDDIVVPLDQIQYEHGTGPCVDAYREGRITRIDDTSIDPRWEQFATATAKVGFHATLSAPLAVADHSIGAINLYSTRAEAFHDLADVRIARFSAPAAAVVANTIVLWEARRLAAGLQQALESRATIEQAKGVLMERHGIGADDAFDQLRRASQEQNRKLRDIATEIVEGR